MYNGAAEVNHPIGDKLFEKVIKDRGFTKRARVKTINAPEHKIGAKHFQLQNAHVYHHPQGKVIIHSQVSEVDMKAKHPSVQIKHYTVTLTSKQYVDFRNTYGLSMENAAKF